MFFLISFTKQSFRFKIKDTGIAKNIQQTLQVVDAINGYVNEVDLLSRNVASELFSHLYVI